jgi:hypothetical protein
LHGVIVGIVNGPQPREDREEKRRGQYLDQAVVWHDDTEDPHRVSGRVTDAEEEIGAESHISGVDSLEKFVHVYFAAADSHEQGNYN